MTDRFCVLGTADEHVAKLRELADAGVDQFNLYLMNGDEEAQLEAYGRDVIPALSWQSAAATGRHGQAGQRGPGIATMSVSSATLAPAPVAAAAVRERLAARRTPMAGRLASVAP